MGLTMTESLRKEPWYFLRYERHALRGVFEVCWQPSPLWFWEVY